MGFDELLTRTLWVTVWHDKFGRNCFLGEVQIPMNTHFDEDRPLEEEPLPKWYSLTDKVDIDRDMRDIDIRLVGGRGYAGCARTTPPPHNPKRSVCI